MSKAREKMEAIKLRKSGYSISDISKYLKVSRGSVSNWVADIKLTQKQQDNLYRKMVEAGHKGRILGALRNKNKKQDNIRRFREDGLKTIKKLSDRDLLLICSSLYWSEGGKKNSRFVFINSDPAMIKIMYEFLVRNLKIEKNRIRLSIQINEIHKPRIKKVLNFWSNLLDLSSSSFDKVYYVKIKPKKKYQNYDDYYGIARLRVLKSSDLLYKFLGIIEAIKNKAEVA